MTAISRQDSQQRVEADDNSIAVQPGLARMAREVDSQAPPMRVAQAARVLQVPAQENRCQLIRHWSEIFVLGEGVLGCALIGIGVFGGGPLFWVTGGLNVIGAVPVYPIVRRYGTVRQQVAILEGVIRDQRATIEEIAQQLELLSGAVNELGDHESDISEHVEVLQEGIERLHDAAHQLGARIEQNRQERDELQEAWTDHRESLRNLEEHLLHRNQELAALQETAAALGEQPALLIDRLSERRDGWQQIAHQIEQVRPSLEQERGLLRQLLESANALEDTREIRQQVTLLEGRLQSFFEGLSQLQSQQEDQMAQIARDQEAIEAALPSLQRTLDGLEQQLEALSPDPV